MSELQATWGPILGILVLLVLVLIVLRVFAGTSPGTRKLKSTFDFMRFIKWDVETGTETQAHTSERTAPVPTDSPTPPRDQALLPLPASSPALASLLATSADAHNHLTGIIELAKPIAITRYVWNAVERTLFPFRRDETTTMQLMSLITPEVWKHDQGWMSYHEDIRSIAMNANRGMARRLHVIDRADLEDASKTRVLLNLVISEHLCRIRARVLCLDTAEIQHMRESGSAHGHHQGLHFTPFDAATITNQAGQYAVIFSDIRPYFLGGNPSAFTIYAFDDAQNYLYYSLRANFYRAWHQSHLDSIFCLVALYHKAKRLNGGAIVDEDGIHAFGGEDRIGGHPPKRDEIVAILDHLRPPRNGAQIVERERELESLLVSARGGQS